MQPVHKTLLEVNEDFLVSEAPAAPLLQALIEKDVLTDLDLQQLRSLQPQGPRAVKRFVLHALPHRGPLAYPSLLEALQEAQAQHLVDLLLEGEAVLSAAVKPIELPETPERSGPAEDPNEYAHKLRANRDLIESAVKPEDVVPTLLQNGVLTSLEEGLLEAVGGQHALSWSVLWGVLMQRGLRAYHAFMGALLQNGYSALFHTIQETKVTGTEALTPALNRNIAKVAPDTKHPAAEDVYNHPSIVPRSEGSPVALPLRSTPHRSVIGTRRPEVNPRRFTRPYAGSPGYSLGDLDFMYTPRISDARVQHPAHVSRSVDLLYSPTWTDRYNHLRQADVKSPYLDHKGYADGEKQNDSDNPLLDFSHPSRHGSVDLSDKERDVAANENPASDGTTDDQKDAALFGRLEAISEQDAGSDTTNHAGDDGTTGFSAGDRHDQEDAGASREQDLNNRSSPTDRVPNSPKGDDSPGETQNTTNGSVSPKPTYPAVAEHEKS